MRALGADHDPAMRSGRLIQSIFDFTSGVGEARGLRHDAELKMYEAQKSR
jgi:hypothetical protein